LKFAQVRGTMSLKERSALLQQLQIRSFGF
jgi:hypothetical protein